MRDYNLQQAVKAVGAKFVMQEEVDDECVTQFRMLEDDGTEIQVVSTFELDGLTLVKWGYTRANEKQCEKCGRVVRRGDWGPNSLCGWARTCLGANEQFVCLDPCVPVVIRTQMR